MARKQVKQIAHDRADANVRIRRSLHELAKSAALKEKRTLAAFVELAIEARLRQTERNT